MTEELVSRVHIENNTVHLKNEEEMVINSIAAAETVFNNNN